jgi:hypothetical protein
METLDNQAVENQVENQVDVQVSNQPNNQSLAENQAQLSDGRIVELRESTGADEMIVAAELGDLVEANGAGMIVLQSCLIAKTIVKINDQSLPRMGSYAAYRDFLSQFKTRDWNKIRILYTTLNGVDEKGNV